MKLEFKYGFTSFGNALEFLKGEAHYQREGTPIIQRRGWNGKGMYVALQVPDKHSKMTLRFLYMKTVEGDLVPWLASQTDMLYDDWQIGRRYDET